MSIVFDPALIAAAPNASLDGIPLRINPQSCSLGYTVKTSQTQTVGGMVVQVYGVDLHDIVIQGVFGSGGWTEQQAFFDQIHAIVYRMTMDQRAQVPFAKVGTDVVLSTGAVRFAFPLLGYDLQVWVKDLASLQGPAVVVDAGTTFNPSWQLTLLIDNDNSGLLRSKVANEYISRVANGLGSGELGPSGMPNPYLASNVSYVRQFLSTYGGGASNFAAYLAAAYGPPGTTPTPATSAAVTSAGSSTSRSGNEATVWNFLVGKGLSAVAAAGIMGNLQQESGFNPQALQPSTTSPTPPWSGGDYNTGLGYGIAQWTASNRQQALQAYAAAHNQPVDSLSLQLAFLWEELSQSYASTLSAVQASTSPAAAAAAFNSGYEGGSDTPIRQSNAQQIYAQYTSGTTSSGPHQVD